jgi:uncharacterized protein YkwD
VAAVLVPSGAGRGPAEAAEATAEPGLERSVAQAVNRARMERGLPALAVDRTLGAVARRYSCRMARENFIAHVPPSGGTVGDRVKSAGTAYRAVGENLASTRDARDPVASAVRGWMASPGHRKNILAPSFTRTGVGVCRLDRSHLFTQIFLQPPDAPAR